jgi:DNA-binding NarL/FixJ family response regulator
MEGAAMSIRVLIADDHPLVRDGLRFAIDRSDKGIEIVGEASDGLETLSVAEKNPVDVFILDVTMPRLNGLETARELIRRYPACRIIILSMHDSQAIIEEAIKVGAHGYLTKETASRIVVDAICELFAGGFYFSPDITHVLVDKFRMGGRKPGYSKRIAYLTSQERIVLQRIAEGRSTKEIAADLGRTVNTVQSHRKNLMAKLNIHKETDLVRFAIKEGIAKL